MSANKMNVTHLMGGGGSIGEVNPVVGATTDKGVILSLDAGNYTVVVARGSGDFQQRFYTKDLFITYANATGGTSWPTGDGSIIHGHTGLWPSGVTPGVGTGMYMSDGDNSVVSFSR